MNIQEVQALTDDEIRVKVAELQGWKNVHRFDKWKEGGTASHNDGDLVGDFNGRTRCHLPNYPADLNACHEVERTLTIDQASQYREDLIYVIANAHWQSHGPAGDYDYHATARQRCEALILTLTQP